MNQQDEQVERDERDERNERGDRPDHFVWGVILGGAAGAAAWLTTEQWWLAGAGMLAGIAWSSWKDQTA